MTFGETISHCFRNYVNGAGRAARSEFWYWVLFTILLGIVTTIIDAAVFPGNTISPVNTIAGILTLLPSISVQIRRLHDIDRSGWWLLIFLTIIGVFVLLYWACLRGTVGPNRYGADPLA